MAIEFHCPYCTAVIRVPDSAAGRKGRCPKCDTLLIIPTVERPAQQPAPVQPVSGKPAGETQSGLRRADETVADQPAVKGADGTPVPWIVPPEQLKSTSAGGGRESRRKRRPRRGRVWLIGLPVIMFLIIFGIMASFMLNRMPELNGTVTGYVLEDHQLPTDTLAWTATSLTDEQAQQLRAVLEEKPETLVSERMTCTLAGREDGLGIELSASDTSAWYRVKLPEQSALGLWMRKNQTPYNQMRATELQKKLTEYTQEKLSSSGGRGVAFDAAAVRDAVGLNGRVNTLGFLVEAIVQGRAVRCASEDEAGNLYFALPRGITGFQVRGRTLSDGKRHFPGEYTIVVDPKPIPETPAAAEPAAPESAASEPAAPESTGSEPSMEKQD